MKSFWRTLAGRFNLLLSQYEKVVLALLSVVIALSGTVWFRRLSASQNNPASGGSYVEGAVSSQVDVGQIAARLTRTGLFGFSDSGELTNQLVSAWQNNSDYTEFRFILNPAIDEQEIVDDFNRNENLLGPIEATAETNSVVVKTASPNPNLPILLAEPLFNYGPYKLSKKTDETVIFTRSTREGAVSAYLNKIVIHLYKDEAGLNSALRKNKLDGVAEADLTDLPGSYSRRNVPLSQYYAVLFNFNKSPFRDPSVGKAVGEGKISAKEPFVLTVPDKEPQKTLADQLLRQWREAGASVTSELKSIEEIKTKIGPSRNFQAMLTGLDYGIELDPYYLWHSSQIRPPGNNLTGVKAETIDQLVTQVRQTNNLAKRVELINSLHSQLNQAGAAMILQRQSYTFIVSDAVRFAVPWLSASVYDRFQDISRWSVK